MLFPDIFPLPLNLARRSSTDSESFTVPLITPLSPSLDIQINDSLSICEFLAESHPTLPLWPKDTELRAIARSAVAEMHSGFGEIRNTYCTNFVGKYTGNIVVTEQGRKEIERMLALWDEARKRTIAKLEGEEDEGFLFGKFGIADAFFWPVLWVSYSTRIYPARSTLFCHLQQRDFGMAITCCRHI